MPRSPATANSSPTKPAADAKSAPQRALDKLGLSRDVDLALHLPLRYEDETRVIRIVDLRDGDSAQVEGVIHDCQVHAQGRRQLVARLRDASGELVLRFIHFYPSHLKNLAAGQRLRVRGEVRGGFFGREMVHPTFRSVTDETPLAKALTPVYPSNAALPQAYLRKAIATALQRVDLAEIVPDDLLPGGLPSLKQSLQQLHHPAPEVSPSLLEDRTQPAWQRLKFDELLAQQISQAQARRARALQRAPRFEAKRGGLQEHLLPALPFELTPAQRRVIEEIGADLARRAEGDAEQSVPMHRLLQGDVGSGKTVVAALVAALVMAQGWQCALMAPTEILAEQHFRKLVGWLEPLGIQVAWLTGSRKGKIRQRMLEAVASGDALLVVGTHAVIQDDVRFAKLGLAIIDEQHRFGVAQRLSLRAKLVDGAATTGLEPHLLMMSATPIPRTLAMTLFADLDISTIDQLPPGRTPVLTKIFSDGRREAVIRTIRDAVADGRQVYWVCPLIEESEHVDLQNATATHDQLKQALPDARIGLLHGRMSSGEKAAVMALFSSGQMALLVSTTVIEVGVDVPNASLMVIEHAERFGLSQLHQLRGRVGRGGVASVCVLLYATPLSDTGKARLKAMAETSDGFEIARRDLEIRGPGEFLGARQSGVPLLRFADLAEDQQLVQQARDVAHALLDRHPDLARQQMARWQNVRADYLKA
ncbi:MAG: ATP-dependent DNA helicase RecG [Ideonella sp.]